MIASILDPIYQFVSSILAVFYEVTRDYTASIALLTIVIMIVVLPLTLKSTKSMLEMQQLQPELKKLQAQYPDMQQRNEAMMALYKEHNVSPLGGCVPMLLPLPVFYVMWHIIRGLTRKCTTGLLTGNVKYSDAKAVVGSFCPEHISVSTKLFKALVGATKMKSLGLDLSAPALETIRNNIPKGLPYVGLVLLVTASSYYQQRQVTVRNKNAPANPQQQMLLKVFPVLTGGFSLFFPAALIMYWLVQNVFRIGQNAYITRRFYGEGGLGHKAALASAAAKELADKNKGDKSKAIPAKTASKPAGGKPGARPTKPVRPAAKSNAGQPEPKQSKPAAPGPKANAGKPETKPPANGEKPSGSSRPAPQRPRPSRPAPRPKPNEK